MWASGAGDRNNNGKKKKNPAKAVTQAVPFDLTYDGMQITTPLPKNKKLLTDEVFARVYRCRGAGVVERSGDHGRAGIIRWVRAAHSSREKARTKDQAKHQAAHKISQVGARSKPQQSHQASPVFGLRCIFRRPRLTTRSKQPTCAPTSDECARERAVSQRDVSQTMFVSNISSEKKDKSGKTAPPRETHNPSGTISPAAASVPHPIGMMCWHGPSCALLFSRIGAMRKAAMLHVVAYQRKATCTPLSFGKPESSLRILARGEGRLVDRHDTLVSTPPSSGHRGHNMRTLQRTANGKPQANLGNTYNTDSTLFPLAS